MDTIFPTYPIVSRYRVWGNIVSGPTIDNFAFKFDFTS